MCEILHLTHRDLREKRDGRDEGEVEVRSRGSRNFELFVAPVARVLLVSLMLHIRDAAGMKSAWAQAFLKRSSTSAAWSFFC